MSLSSHDPSLGLRYVGNNEALYRKVLAKFVDQQADAPAQIAAALDAGDLELAQRLAHTLKGLAASMGLPDVQETATAIDATLKTGDSPKDMIPVLSERLQTALTAVAAYLA